VTLPQIALVLAAGLFAGTINTIVGSGSLITFPTLLAIGLPPVVANVSNTIGLAPGVMSGIVGYRRELTGQGPRMVRLGVVAALGGLTGGLLLLLLPSKAFERVVPFLILIACFLVAVQPRISKWVAARHEAGLENHPLLLVTVFLTAVYGGYFGAAMGVIFIALLAIFLRDDLQRLNALKNVMAVSVKGVAAILFIALAPIRWDASIVLAIGAIVGGQVGAAVGRRLPPLALRAVIIVVGVTVAVRLLLG
jgi:uncharacterized protein